jgi:hypothetical protein
MREDTVSFSMRWSLVWSVPYSVVASILFWKYRNTHSSVPRIFQMAASTLILLTYFVVIVVLKKGGWVHLSMSMSLCRLPPRAPPTNPDPPRACR